MYNNQRICGSNIMGGLGNKLFQIAHMYGYSIKNGYRPVLPDTNIQNNHQTTVNWSHFYRNAGRESYNSITVCEPNDSACMYIDYSPYTNNNQNILFHGYFQSEKYFDHCKDFIYEQFKCPEKDSQIIQRQYPGIEKGVFFHVRRGDYVNHPFHFIDLVKYFDRALEKFDLENDTFYIFSDDIDFCRSYYPITKMKNVVFVVDKNEIRSLWTLSLCGKGGICSNSTFGWWGAWLCKYREGMNCRIIYPNRQFPHDKIKCNDLIPSNFEIETVE
jgi:hypothetical protein